MGTDDSAGAARGAPGRVAAVHAQARRGLLVSGAFVAAAVVMAIARSDEGWWLPLHLFVVGGLLSAISAAAQMLAVTWSASPPPSDGLARSQRWLLAAGAVALVVGRDVEGDGLLLAGGAAVILAVLALAVVLLRVRQQAVTDRYAPAIEAYVAAIVAGAVGMGIGLALGSGHVGDRYVELRGAHLVINLFGLVGLVIAGTLPFFSATQVRSKMSPRATPVAMRATFLGLVAAVTVAALGEVVDRPAVVALGLGLYAAGLVVVAAMLPVYAKARLEWAGPRALQLLAGLAWWTAMTAALAVAALREADDGAILRALVIGGFAQILVASLAYFGPVLRGGGHKLLSAGFATTRSWLSLAAGNVAAAAALAEAEQVLAAALVVWLADVAVRATRLLVTPQSPPQPTPHGP